MKTEKEIKEMIADIKKGEFVGGKNITGLTKITEQGDNWIGCLEWVIEDV